MGGLDGTRVSAVIPAFNAEGTLSRTIESALAQTHEMAEVIVVDDGSTDRTSEIAASFPDVTVIRQANRGLAGARNTGIRSATGTWVAFLDADDTWEPGKTEAQLRGITDEVGVVHANRFGSITFARLWKRRVHVTPSGAMVRKAAIDQAGGFDEAFRRVEDLNLWLRIAFAGWRFAASDPALFHWTPSAGHLSQSDVKMVRAELENIEKIGGLIHCSRQGIASLCDAVRLEYARNLIGGGEHWEALDLLSECRAAAASRWLEFSARSGMRRLARRDILSLLHNLNIGRHAPCPGGCLLSAQAQAECGRLIPAIAH